MSVHPKRLVAFSTVGAGLVAVSVLLWVQQGPSSSAVEVYSQSSVRFSCPEDPTDAELDAFAMHRLTGAPLPPGFSIEESGGDIVATLSDYTLFPSGEKQLVVRLSDEIEDLDSARLFVGGQLAFHATRSSGAIIDRGNLAVATLTTWVLPPSPALSVKVEWSGADGTQTAEVGVQ